MREEFAQVAPEQTRFLYSLSAAIAKGPLPADLRELLSVYVSQINRCAHCIEVHWHKATRAGVSEEKLRLLPAFREARRFDSRELVALEVAEAITTLPASGVSEELWHRVVETFPDPSLRMDLVYLIILMNGWNRLSIALDVEPPK